MTSSSFNLSPRPNPQFFNEYNILATKKERYSSTPKVRKVPPKPPSKSITQYSRLSCTLNNSQSNQKAQIITFKCDNQPKLSSLYDESSNESYFKQCFIIEEKIGSGSFGDVYKVKYREDNKYYAVKVSREKFKGRLDREEKLNEVCKHEQLPEHDHLVKFYCAWEERQRLYIQTELCATSLSALAETNHNIPEETVWCYLVDLLKAIDHLHSYSLIHLDIKPENIFISQEDLCKLGDFGLIYDINNPMYKEATEGDPKYLASEIMQGVFTKSADIFSLGMTILELASDLDLPSRGQGWHMLRSGNIPEHIFSDMSKDLKTIISSMLNPDYTLRPTAQDLLNHFIVQKYERKRRNELEHKKTISFLNNTRDILKHPFKSRNSIFYNIWINISNFVNILFYPFRNILSKFLPEKAENTKSMSIDSSPINYNRTYVSNFLDQYSDDETNDIRQFSNLSLDMSFSSDDEIFNDNLSSRNLCSTVNRNNIPNNRFIMPKISPLFQGNASGDNFDSIKSVIQRLTFDEFSSDEMELSEDENDSGVKNNSSNILSSDKLAKRSQLSFRLRQNVSRKNLMKTFDEIESTDFDT